MKNSIGLRKYAKKIIIKPCNKIFLGKELLIIKYIKNTKFKKPKNTCIEEKVKI